MAAVTFAGEVVGEWDEQIGQPGGAADSVSAEGSRQEGDRKKK
jgi:hypothetical protein